MPLDHYVLLGRSGLRVSPLCLGTMTFGEEWGWGSSVAESGRILDRYLDLGGNFVDTANVYTHGHSEKIIGDHLAADPAKRQRCVVATKFFGCRRPGDPNAGGASRKNVAASCEASLRRLRTDCIDLYWMHCWDYHTPIDETLRALDDLVTAGKIRYIGFSDTPAWKVAEAQVTASFRGWAPLIALQVEYSLAERTPEGDLLPMAREHGLGVTPWSPLKGGVLSGKYRRAQHGAQTVGRGERTAAHLNDRNYAIIEALVAAAEAVGSTPSRVALRWLLGVPGVASPIVGARTLAQLDDNLAACDVDLPAAQRAALEAASTPTLNFPAAFVRAAVSFRNPSTTIAGETGGPSALTPPGGQTY